MNMNNELPYRLLKTTPKKIRNKKKYELLINNDSIVLPFIAPGFLTSSELLKLDKLNIHNSSNKATAVGVSNESIRDSYVGWISPDDKSDWLFSKIENLIININKQCKFELLGFFTGLQLGTYSSGGHYDWHLDIGQGEASNRKLSISIQLSQPADYDGGELEFRMGKEIVTAPNDIGTAIVFPSYLLHRVKPVTRGVRKSLVTWVYGPAFK